MAVIFKPDYITPTVQSSWKVNPHACGRPPADSNLSVICWHSRVLGEMGSDMDYFAPCCPPRGGENSFIYDHGCHFMFCFTNDMTMAEAYPGCISSRTRMKITELGANGTEAKNLTGKLNGTRPRCEYVDYDMLRAGVKTSVGSPQPRAGAWWVAMGSFVVLGLAQLFLSF